MKPTPYKETPIGRCADCSWPLWKRVVPPEKHTGPARVDFKRRGSINLEEGQAIYRRTCPNCGAQWAEEKRE